jgi:hypothetical protein
MEGGAGSDVPGLTPGERERLAILSEECGEVVRAIGKIQRYGWESSSPFVVGGRTNRMALETGAGQRARGGEPDARQPGCAPERSAELAAHQEDWRWRTGRSTRAARCRGISSWLMVQSIQESAAGN